MSAWKDISGFLRNDTDRTPRSFELRTPHLRLVVTRHIHFAPDLWVYKLNGAEPVALAQPDIDAAKAEAIRIVIDQLEETLDWLRKVKADIRETQKPDVKSGIEIVEAGVHPGHQTKYCDDCRRYFESDEHFVRTCSHQEYLTLCDACYKKRGNQVR